MNQQYGIKTRSKPVFIDVIFKFFYVLFSKAQKWDT